MRVVLVMMFVVCLAAPAAAQDRPRFDVSGGYSFLRDDDVDENFHGWLASVTGHVNTWLGIVGEVGGNYKSVTFEDFDIGDIDVDLSIHSFMGGVRFSGRGNPAVTPFAQILAGAVRASGSAFGESASRTEFALQPGGGVDVWLSRNVGLRLGGDYRRIFVDEEGANEFRFHAGIVVSGG